MSGNERFTDMLSLKRALNPFTLYNSLYFCLLIDESDAPTPCSPIPEKYLNYKKFHVGNKIL